MSGPNQAQDLESMMEDDILFPFLPAIDNKAEEGGDSRWMNFFETDGEQLPPNDASRGGHLPETSIDQGSPVGSGPTSDQSGSLGSSWGQSWTPSGLIANPVRGEGQRAQPAQPAVPFTTGPVGISGQPIVRTGDSQQTPMIVQPTTGRPQYFNPIGGPSTGGNFGAPQRPQSSHVPAQGSAIVRSVQGSSIVPSAQGPSTAHSDQSPSCSHWRRDMPISPDVKRNLQTILQRNKETPPGSGTHLGVAEAAARRQGGAKGCVAFEEKLSVKRLRGRINAAKTRMRSKQKTANLNTHLQELGAMMEIYMKCISILYRKLFHVYPEYQMHEMVWFRTPDGSMPAEHVTCLLPSNDPAFLNELGNNPGNGTLQYKPPNPLPKDQNQAGSSQESSKGAEGGGNFPDFNAISPGPALARVGSHSDIPGEPRSTVVKPEPPGTPNTNQVTSTHGEFPVLSPVRSSPFLPAGNAASNLPMAFIVMNGIRYPVQFNRSAVETVDGNDPRPNSNMPFHRNGDSQIGPNGVGAAVPQIMCPSNPSPQTRGEGSVVTQSYTAHIFRPPGPELGPFTNTHYMTPLAGPSTGVNIPLATSQGLSHPYPGHSLSESTFPRHSWPGQATLGTPAVSSASLPTSQTLQVASGLSSLDISFEDEHVDGANTEGM